ncbi:MAG: aquaporin, partial [Pyrinomonadaceae bacterium]
MANLPRRLAAEFIGTAGLLAAVVGSGIMAERLAGGNVAVALLANTAATGAALFVLILSFAAVSGAHFNPAVTITELMARRIAVGDAVGYLTAQLTGAAAGVILANAMFGLPLVFVSLKVRNGTSQWLSEAVATFGLIFIIAATVRIGSKFAVPLAVAAYISAAYWFTA